MSARSRRAPWPALAAGILLGSALAAAGDIRPQAQDYRQNLRDEQNHLDQLKSQLKNEKQLVRQGFTQERHVLRQIHEAEGRIEDAEEVYAEHQHNLETIQQTLAQLRASMVQTESDLQATRALLATRLRLLYREGRWGFFHTMVSSPTLAEALLRVKFFHILAAQNAYWIERLNAARARLTRQRQQLAAREQQAAGLKARAARTLADISVQKNQRERLLDKVRNERSTHEEAAQELAVAAGRLTALVGELKARALALERQLAFSGEAFAQKQSSLPWPTRGRVITRFGRIRFERFKTYLVYKGIDIAGSIGQNVCAVAPGNVLFAEWFEGYGRLVILDHGEGYNTIYAHLSKISVSPGQRVGEGQVLGTLGDSGTWKGPCLYFEIRRRGEAQDPSLWLNH